MTNPEQISGSELKEKGNACVKNSQYEEAILHYTHAIKLEPRNHSLYSNRSFAFLKLQQYYLAMEDANQTIALKSDWAKGYFRKAEIEMATFQFPQALSSYKRALQYQPDDHYIVDSLKKASTLLRKDQRADDQIPWVGAGVGLVVGVLIVLADILFTNKPTLSHPFLMVLLTIAVAMIGFGIAKLCRYYVKCQRDGMLQAPVDLMPENTETPEPTPTSQGTNTGEKTGVRYSKAQARMRFKKGKL